MKNKEIDFKKITFKEYIKSRNITWYRISKDNGYSMPNIQHLMKWKKKTKLITFFQKISKYLGINIEQLIDLIYKD